MYHPQVCSLRCKCALLFTGPWSLTFTAPQTCYDQTMHNRPPLIRSLVPCFHCTKQHPFLIHAGTIVCTICVLFFSFLALLHHKPANHRCPYQCCTQCVGTHGTRLFLSLSELKDLFVAGRNQSAANQPNNLAEGHPLL